MEEGKLSGESSMFEDLGCLHSVYLTTVAGAPVGTPGLALQTQMKVLRSRFSGWVDSTTHLGVVSFRKHNPKKAMWSQDAGGLDLAVCNAV